MTIGAARPRARAKMRVDVALAPALLRKAPGPSVTAVVIDVIRFTSVVAAALSSGAAGVLPVAELEQARRQAAERGALLGGERGGLPPEGFDLGNSPGSYTPQACADRLVVMTTTNGTRALEAVRGAGRVLTGALVNAEATARAVVAGGAEEVLLVCAASRGVITADDVACAGCLAGSLALMAGAEPTDATRVAAALFDAWKTDLHGLLRRCRSGRNVSRLGLEKDLEFCARVDTVPVVSELDDQGILRAIHP